MVTLGEMVRWITYTLTTAYGRVAARLLARDKLVVNSEKKFRALLESAPDAIVIVDWHGHIALVNEQTERLFGYPRDELIGQNLTELIPQRFRAWHREHQKRFMQAPRTREMGRELELLARRKDGSEFPVEISLGPLRTDQGLLVSAVVRDVTWRKEIEAELKLRAQELERSNEDLEQFAYVASHDLQAPLRTVGALVQMLGRRYEGRLDADADELLRQTVDATRRMQRLIDDLLSYSRVSQGPPAPGRVETGDAVDEVLRSLAEEISDTGARIEVGDLPAVEGEGTMIEQLFQNLIANALKFTRESPPTVHVRAERDGPRWRFSVADNGIGIDPDHAERIFQMFQRLHGSDEFPGTGIGLAICKRIVEAHGGEIHAEPSPAGGTIMTFTLPAPVPDREAVPDA